MADFNIPVGTTQTISGLGANSTDTVEGNSTAAYGAGGGTLNITGPLAGQCNVTVTGGVFDVDGIANNDSITLNNATLDVTGGDWNSSTTINFGTGSSGVIVPPADATSPNLGGVQFTGLNSGDYISTGSTAPITNVSWSIGTLNFTQGGINYAVAATLAAGATPNFQAGTENGVPVILNSTSVCFLRGTQLQTPVGSVAIERLAIGDLVTVACGEAWPIKWIGHRRIDLSRHPKPESVAPIRICQGAFAGGVPCRDLLVSPDHGTFAEGKLICARQLVNGASIRQEGGATSVEYFHLELAAHAIILAEGLPAESYLDTGNRGFFANGGAPLVLHPDLTDETGYPMRETGSCAPFVWDEASVRPVWQRLAARSAELGQPVALPETTHDAELRLVANGRTLRPVHNSDGKLGFVLPKGVAEVRLVSRAAMPTDAKPWLEDRRCLGVYVKRITLRSAHEMIDVPLDSPVLQRGWWTVERDGVQLCRWTAGDASLPLPFVSGPCVLELQVGTMAYPVSEARAA